MVYSSRPLNFFASSLARKAITVEDTSYIREPRLKGFIFPQILSVSLKFAL